MWRTINIGAIPGELFDDPDFTTKMKTAAVGDALGSEKLYVNIDFVKPGGTSAKYHAHSAQEEFFLILSGRGLLRIGGEQIELAAGDAVSKPAGKNVAHQFINTGTEVMRILDVGTREPVESCSIPTRASSCAGVTGPHSAWARGWRAGRPIRMNKRLLHRQRDRERRALTLRVDKSDRSAVHLNDAPGDRQAQAAAAVA